MKKIFFISFIFLTFIQLFTSNIFAQRDMFSKEVDSTLVEEHVVVKDTSFSLKNYYTPDIVRNKLEISLNSNGNVNSTYNKDNSVDTIINLKTNGTSYYTGTLNTAFESYVNTRKRISLMQISLNVNSNINNTFTNTTKLILFDTIPPANANNFFKSNSNNETVSFNYTNQFYNSKNQYLLLGLNTRLDASSNLQRQSNFILQGTSINNLLTETKTSGTEFSVIPNLGVGIGRLESVEDARQTLYIVEALKKSGVLIRDLTNDELFNLSQIISQVKNKRFLDSRLHLMDEISEVNSFFVNNNLLDKSDAPYFTTLYDNWENGALFERKSGQTFEISLSPSADWTSTKTSTSDTTWTKDSYSKMVGNVVLSYNLEKPASLKLQHSINAQIILSSEFQNNKSIFSSSSNESLSKSNNSGATLFAGYSLGFYPNSRTYLSAGISENFQYRFHKDIITGLSDSNPWTKNIYSNTSFNLSAYYYVSPQMRVSATSNLINSYSKDSSVNNNHILEIFSATISYSFF